MEPQAQAEAAHQEPAEQADIEAQPPEALSIEQQQGVIQGNPDMGPTSTEERDGLVEKGTWHGAYDDDPVSPASSSGSALDPHLFR